MTKILSNLLIYLCVEHYSYSYTHTLLNSRIKRAWQNCMTTCINDTVIKQC